MCKKQAVRLPALTSIFNHAFRRAQSGILRIRKEVLVPLSQRLCFLFLGLYSILISSFAYLLTTTLSLFYKKGKGYNQFNCPVEFMIIFSSRDNCIIPVCLEIPLVLYIKKNLDSHFIAHKYSKISDVLVA